MILRELVARFGVSVDSKPLGELDKRLSAAATKLKGFGAALAGTMAAQKLSAFAHEMESFGSAIGDTSKRLGVAAEDLYEWHEVARTADVPIEAMDSVLQKLSRTTAAARTGNKGLAKDFRDLGVSLKDTEGRARPIGDVLQDTMGKLAGMEDASKRTAFAVRLLGPAGSRLFAAFADGGEGVEKFRSKLRELTGGTIDQFVAESEAAGDQIDQWNVVMQSMRIRLALHVLPLMRKLYEFANQIGTAFVKLTKETKIVQAAFVVAAGVAAAVGVQMLLPWLPLIALIGGLVLIVEDLIVWLNGGESAIGTFLDTIGGADAGAIAAQALKDAWQWIKDELPHWINAASGVFGDLKKSISDAADWLKVAWGAAQMAFHDVGVAFEIAELKIKSAVLWVARLITLFKNDLPNAARNVGNMITSPLRALGRAVGMDIDEPQQHATNTSNAVEYAQRANASRRAALAGSQTFNNYEYVRNQGVSTPVVAAPSVPSQIMSAPMSIGSIVVQGTANAEETADLVMSRIRDEQADQLRNASEALSEYSPG